VGGNQGNEDCCGGEAEAQIERGRPQGHYRGYQEALGGIPKAENAKKAPKKAASQSAAAAS